MAFLPKWADNIERVVTPIAKGFIFAAMMAALLMVLFLVAHIVGRLAFNSPFPATVELEEFLLVIVTFCGLAYAGILGRHIKVDLIMSKFPQWVQHVTDTCTGLTSLALWGLIVWRGSLWTASILDPLLVTPILQWPKFPFACIFVIGSALFCLVIIAEVLRSLHGAIAEGKGRALWIIPGLIIIAGIVFISLQVELPMSGFLVGVIGIGFLILLIFLRMPIGFAMGFIGLIGAWYFMGLDAGLMALGIIPYTTAAWYLLIVIPLFILMGEFCFRAKISKELYDTAHAWLGRLPGGIASATVGACAGFAAICGDSLAEAAAMGTVALPELKRHNYDDSLATGCIAAGGTLGILIPPSMGFIFYSLITEVSTGKLFIAGIIPGITLASLFILSITIRCKLNPKLGPPGPSTTFKQKILSLKGTWAMLVLFVLVIGGIYMGFFTVIEAAAVGAFGAMVMMAIKRRFTRQTIYDSLLETGRTTSVLMTIFIGVWILGYFMSASKMPLVMAASIASLEVNRYLIFVAILFIYVILGCLMNIIPMIILTLPIFWPTIVSLQFDLIWFGVVMVIIMEMGQITPPIGMNVFVIAGVARDIPLSTVFKGIFPFLIVEVVFIVILTLFPQIATWLPSLM